MPKLDFGVEKIISQGESSISNGMFAVVDTIDFKFESYAIGNPTTFSVVIKIQSKEDNIIEINMDDIMIMNEFQEKYWIDSSLGAVGIHQAKKGKDIVVQAGFKVNKLSEKNMAYIPIKNISTKEENSIIITFKADSNEYRKYMNRFLKLSASQQEQLLVFVQNH